MKRVYAAEHGLMTERIKDILEEEGIDCMIKNQNLSGALGEIPPIECWPEVWVMEDADYDHAKTIVADLLKVSTEYRTSWICKCGEKIEGQFTDCWNCGIARAENSL
jgi:hypothetical protein